MKRAAITFVVLWATFAMAIQVFAQDIKPSNCAEDLEVLKLVYATARSGAESYLENLARTDLKLKAAQAQLAEAQKKLQALEAPKKPEKIK